MEDRKFGYFDDLNREYVITDPKTPWPWINYLGNEDFFSLISHTAGGYSFYKDAKFRRITRYRYNNVPMDNGGRYFYINDNDTVWSPGWKPCKTPLDFYECRHGMGYTSFDSAKDTTKFMNHLRRNNVDDVVLQYRETLNEWWAVKATF